MAKNWFISDPHFDTPGVAESRGYATTTEMDTDIIRHWLDQVATDDTVWVLGDLSTNQFGRALEIVRNMPGHKMMVLGNHDPLHPFHEGSWQSEWILPFLSVFDWVGTFCALHLNQQPFLLNHFPYQLEEEKDKKYAQYCLRDLGIPLLHGHTHATEARSGDHSINVGWDAWRRLVSEDEILDMLDTPSHTQTELAA